MSNKVALVTGASSGIGYEAAIEPFLTENNTMWSYLEPELIPAGADNIESVAKELALSVRSLQCKLSAEKTTFIKQLNHTKELLARNYLKDKHISSDEVAFLIGYSDANAFRRAFVMRSHI